MSSMGRFLPGLMFATVVGVASGYYTFQPIIVEETAAQQHGGRGQAELQANLQGKELLNTAVRKEEAKHTEQDKRIEKAAAITEKDKK